MSIVKSLSVGDGDMFYIRHNSDNFTIIDCCLSDYDRDDIIAELINQSKGKGILRFISTHPDDDHIAGLSYLNKRLNLVNFYCVRNVATKPEETDDFNEYCLLRDHPDKSFYISRGCSRLWMNMDNEERKNSGIEILWPITSNADFQAELKKASLGESPNNISPIIKYRLTEGATVLWMGDLETSFMEKIIDVITPEPALILFAPHHGRKTGTVPDKWLKAINPKLVIIGEAPSKDLNYYAAYNTITQNSAGHITMDCDGAKTHIYVSNDEYSVNFLEDEQMPNTFGTYIGTLSL